MLYNIHNTRQEKKNEIINPLKSIFVARSRARAHSRTFNLSGIKMVTEKKEDKKNIEEPTHPINMHVCCIYRRNLTS